MKTKEVKEQFGWNWIRPETVTIRPEAPLEDALHRMKTFGIHHLLVMKKKELVGLLEARDLVLMMPVGDVKVNEVMRTGIPTIDENADIKTAVETMLSTEVSALPISRDNEICGILTETDLLRLLRSYADKGSGVNSMIQKGEALLTSFPLQKLFKALADAGL